MAKVFGNHGELLETLPIENGGTGATNETAAVNNLWTALATKIRSIFGFNSSNVLSLANGGTGKTGARSCA